MAISPSSVWLRPLHSCSSPRRLGVPARNRHRHLRPASRPRAEIAKAQALFKAGRFEEALAILRPLAAAGPGHLDTRFQVGMAAIGASKKPDIAEAKREALLDEAIAAFRTMLIADPGLVRVRLELARAFFLKGEDTLATRHFRAGAGRRAAGAGGAQRQPVPVSDAGAKALEPAPRHGAGAGQQYLQPGRTNRRSCSTPPVSDGVGSTFHAADEPESGVGISVWAGGRIPVPAGRPRNGVRGKKLAAARGRRRLAPRVPLGRVRPDDRFGAHLGPRWLIDRASEASVLASARQQLARRQ